MAPKRKTAAAVDEIQNDLYALREDIGQLADEVTELLGDKGEDVLRDVKQRVSQIRTGIDGAISEAGARGRAAVRDAKENVDAIGESLEDSIRDRPFTALAVAVGVGAILGATWRR